MKAEHKKVLVALIDEKIREKERAVHVCDGHNSEYFIKLSALHQKKIDQLKQIKAEL